MAYRFISKYKNHFGLRWLLKRMNIYPNAYYNYLKNNKFAYHTQKSKIFHEIKRIYHETGGILGHRGMCIFLARKNIFLSKTTVHKYMNLELQLACSCRKKPPKYKKGQFHKLFPNLLDREFKIQEKNKVWCSDFTYLKLTNGSFRYNCSIIDLYDRSVIATETGKWMTSDLAIKTLKKGLFTQKVKPNTLLFHTDQGVQFRSIEFTNFCLENQIKQSMSKAGCPYDNAPMERFFNTMKTELIYRYHFSTDEELNNAISEYAYVWYNQYRPHSYNEYLTPNEARNRDS